MTVSPYLRLGNDALSAQVKAGVVPVEKPERRKKGPKGLARTQMERKPSTLKRGAVSAATPEQRAKVKGLACIVCARSPVDPAHLIDRSLAPSAGDDTRAVIPLCRPHHIEYDGGHLDLSPYLEPAWRAESAWAVEAVGFFPALRRITGKHWVPLESEFA